MKVFRLTLLLPLLAVPPPLFAATAPAPSPAPASSPASKGTAVRTAPAPVAPKTDPNDVASLRAKAERGNVIAQYNLGLAYAQGRGTAVDRPEAFMWLTIASQSGSTGKALDTLLTSMSSEQIAEGRRRLEAARSANPFLRPPPPPATSAPSVAVIGRAPATSPTPSTAPTPGVPPVAPSCE